MTLALTVICMALAATASPLAPYVDNARVLVISAASGGDPELKRQDAAIARESNGIAERDLVVIRAVAGEAMDDRGRPLDARAVRAAAHLTAGGFGVALIGKDGGVKLVRRHPLSPAELFRTIDAMPMRRDEMKRDGRGSR